MSLLLLVLVAVLNASQEEVADRANSFECVINSTSVGTSPGVEDTPITSDVFTENMLAFDLVYNPLKTRFLTEAESKGASIVNGAQMLVAQAVYSVEIWMGGNIVAHVDMNALVRDIEKAIK